jgi:AGZA family xanthine/uracil permease-like MFS transporter
MLSRSAQHFIQTDLILANGLIVTSLLWGTALSHLIDARIRSAALTLLLAAVFSLFGIIHSPLPDSPIIAPLESIARLHTEGRYEACALQTPFHWAAAYTGSAIAVIAVGLLGRPRATPGEEEPGDL